MEVSDNHILYTLTVVLGLAYGEFIVSMKRKEFQGSEDVTIRSCEIFAALK